MTLVDMSRMLISLCYDIICLIMHFYAKTYSASFSDRNFQNLILPNCVFSSPLGARCEDYTNTAGLIPSCRWFNWYFDILILLPGSCNVCRCNWHRLKGPRAILCLMYIGQQTAWPTLVTN